MGEASNPGVGTGRPMMSNEVNKDLKPKNKCNNKY
jgi:hypothetical protein